MSALELRAVLELAREFGALRIKTDAIEIEMSPLSIRASSAPAPRLPPLVEKDRETGLTPEASLTHFAATLDE